MKVKLGIIGILIFVVIILPEILSNRNDQNVASLPNSPDYSESIGPQIKGPLPNGEKISLVQARTMTSYAIPLPELIEIKQVWASTNLETSEQSFAVEFGIDLYLSFMK